MDTIVSINIKTKFWDELSPHQVHWRMLIDTLLFAGAAVAIQSWVQYIIWAYVLLRMPAILSYIKWSKENSKQELLNEEHKNK